jgi:hypothetical protein
VIKDPIVEESRKAGYELARIAGYDPKVFINNLRAQQKRAQRKPTARCKTGDTKLPVEAHKK